MDKKQTAVKLILDKFCLLSDFDFKSWILNNYDELIEMEREQIIDAYYEGKEYGFKEQGEQYYNETYGGQYEM